jgi:hypothetical protein
VGSLAPVDPNLVQVIANGEAVHTVQGAKEDRSWQVAWTAPTEGTGGVTFHLSVNAVDGDGGRNGDVWDRIQVSIDEIPEFPTILILPTLFALFGLIVLIRRRRLAQEPMQ